MKSEITIIRPTRGWLGLNLKELWSFRELFYMFAWRDVKVRYKQTVIGVLWAVLQPFLLMVVFTVFFGRSGKIDTGVIPYAIFVYVGVLFWNYFANSLSNAASSLVGNQNMIQKIYFPRILMPISSTIVYLLDFAFALIILIGLMIYYHFTPGFLGVVLILPSILITFLVFSGLGLFLASLNVKYRDIRYALPFFIQILIFVTPVIYPASILGEYQWLWYLNPMSGVIDTMRASLLSTGAVNWTLYLASFGVSLLLFIAGVLFFNKTERHFADFI